MPVQVAIFFSHFLIQHISKEGKTFTNEHVHFSVTQNYVKDLGRNCKTLSNDPFLYMIRKKNWLK